MKDIKSLPIDFLSSMGFRPCENKDFLNPMGKCFEPDPAIGTGYYWFYEQPGKFSIGRMEITLKEDFIIEYVQPDFVSINYYETISAEELSPYKKLSAHCIRGHVSEGELFRLRCHKNIPVRGFELMLMPGYYHNYLDEKYPGEFSNTKNAFRSIDGAIDFPELVLVLKQTANFRGTGANGQLYFEGKVAEALSLVIEHTKKADENPSPKQIYRQDLVNLDAVKSYIDDHFVFDLNAKQLSAIACMGQSKLRASFKLAYGCTITEYIKQRRIALAETLLVRTDFPISQIAEAAGYHHAGRFSVLFKKITGLSPEEYRKSMKEPEGAKNPPSL